MNRVIETGDLPAGTTAAPRLARFGVFELDFQSGELRRSGVRIKLQEQPVRLLAVLLEKAGGVVSRDELRQRLWPADTFVDFDHSLNTAIMKLRTALDDAADTPRFIETIARHGYRFIAPLEWVGASPSAAPATDRPQSTSAHRRRYAWLAVAVIVVMVAVGSAIQLSRGRAGAPQIWAIAVLPFVNADPRTEYISDGLTEVLINSISELRDLRVLARTTVFDYKGKGLDPRRVGRELDVPAVIVGTFQQQGQELRVQVEMINVRDGTQIWGRQYRGNLTAVIALQQEIVDDVTARLRPSSSKAELARRELMVPTKPEAWALYLKGLQSWNQRGSENLLQAIEYFNRALALDPKFALAYAGLANTYGVMIGSGLIPPAEGQLKAMAAAERALSLDPTLAEALTCRAAGKHSQYRDFSGAERDFRRAIELNPSYPTAHAWYGGYLFDMGRVAEARQETELAYRLDPLSPPISGAMCWSLYRARRFDDAIAFSRKAAELDPRFSQTACVVSSFVAQNKYAEAVAEFTKPESGIAREFADQATAAFKARGPRGFFEKRLEIPLKQRAAGEYVSPVPIATLYAYLGEADETFRWLDIAYDERSSGLSAFYTLPAFDKLRSDPRFDALARRIGLPQVGDASPRSPS